MKRFAVISVLLISTISYSQPLTSGYTLKFTTLDIVTDAKSLSLGESFVANDESPNSFFENPAALYNRERINLFYNYRSHGWMNTTKDANFSSAGGSAKLPFGKFGFMYNRFTTGEYNADPLNSNATAELIYRTFILAYAYDLSDNLSAGISTKIFNHSFETTGENLLTIKSNNALLFDLGFVWRLGGLWNENTYRDNLKIGASLQNYGTDYEEEYKYMFIEKVKRTIARFLRAGFAYQVNLILGQRTQTNVDLLFTGEYKRLINSGFNETHNVDYWGIGAEATLLKIISLRTGGIINHENNLIYERAKLLWRYGIGLNFPLALFGLDKPVIIHLDYASIPFNEIEFFEIDGRKQNSKESLHAFSISINYLLNPSGQ